MQGKQDTEGPDASDGPCMRRVFSSLTHGAFFRRRQRDGDLLGMDDRLDSTCFVSPSHLPEGMRETVAASHAWRDGAVLGLTVVDRVRRHLACCVRGIKERED